LGSFYNPENGGENLLGKAVTNYQLIRLHITEECYLFSLPILGIIYCEGCRVNDMAYFRALSHSSPLMDGERPGTSSFRIFYPSKKDGNQLHSKKRRTSSMIRLKKIALG
jgi:hypothetical protein